MRLIEIISFGVVMVLCCVEGRTQDKQADFLLLQKKVLGFNCEKVEFKGVLRFYHNHLSDQILNDCVYEYSCSEFSQGAFNAYGFFKGLMMTCDRLTRCNRTSLVETSPLQLTKFGKIKEHWDDYKRSD